MITKMLKTSSNSNHMEEELALSIRADTVQIPIDNPPVFYGWWNDMKNWVKNASDWVSGAEKNAGEGFEELGKDIKEGLEKLGEKLGVANSPEYDTDNHHYTESDHLL